jgi:hypothetical protein
VLVGGEEWVGRVIEKIKSRVRWGLMGGFWGFIRGVMVL